MQINLATRSYTKHLQSNLIEKHNLLGHLLFNFIDINIICVVKFSTNSRYIKDIKKNKINKQQRTNKGADNVYNYVLICIIFSS